MRIRRRMIALCAGLPLLLAACAPGTVGGDVTPTPAVGAADATTRPDATAPSAADAAGPSTAEASATGSASPGAVDPTPSQAAGAKAPARLTQDENTIAGLTVGVSTLEDVIAKYGEPQGDSKIGADQKGVQSRNLQYDGFMCGFVEDAKGQYWMTQFTIQRDIGIEGPRGIHIGMTAEALEALFPDETTRETETSRSKIAYMYAERIESAGGDAPDRLTPPFGYAAYAKGDRTDVSYNFMSAYDWPLLEPKGEGKPGVLLQVNCRDGKVEEITLCAAPVVDS